MFKKILVPIDGSDVAKGILPYVSKIAKGTDATLLLHTVIDPEAIVVPQSVAKPELMMVPPTYRGDYPQIVDRGIATITEATHKTQLEINVIEQVEGGLKIIARDLEEQGVHAEIVATIGSPAKEIIRMAEEKGCDLIAMATRGRNAISRGILGSVTDRVIHTTQIPTLTISPEKAEKYSHGEFQLTSIMCRSTAPSSRRQPWTPL